MTASTRPRETQVLEAGAYLTDGFALFCVVSALAVPVDESWIELENCMTLEARWYTQRQVNAMRLRNVLPLEPASS